MHARRQVAIGTGGAYRNEN